MVGSAAAGIAHDINNQLTLILNHLAVPNLESAREATARCTALTASLLSYCRGSSSTCAQSTSPRSWTISSAISFFRVEFD